MSTLAASRADKFYYGPNYDHNQLFEQIIGYFERLEKNQTSKKNQYKIKSGPKICFEMFKMWSYDRSWFQIQCSIERSWQIPQYNNIVMFNVLFQQKCNRLQEQS
ncbi:unnamed protein product [Paramecium sonneborni]|uniref:Uncharacterized protein n=1 Tax=Paramecium sonneborni TaxID=65129 RepID=A0A8S1RFJ9_9CILI|nr:unnamed protein product [Paramecium sonneborni]